MVATAARGLCRILVVSTLLLSFHSAWAGMIGTEQALAAGQGQAERATMQSLLTRSDLQARLRTMGVDPSDVLDRVAAMTDDEVHALAGKLESVPAGGDWEWWLGLVVVAIVIFMVWGSTSSRS